MDQSSFRSLLASGNASASSSKPVTGRAAGILGGQTLKRGYGSGGSKKTTNFAPKNKDGEGEGSSSGGKSKPAFVPRAAKKDSKYKDRAESRRTGEDDEYKPMQQMLEDFETRAKAEGEDEETIAERRAMLGGDASHSILVKGLDYALLAAKKAEIAAKEGDKLDDEFDQLLERDVEPTQADEAGATKKGKSRDEIMEALKASRKRLASLGGGADRNGEGRDPKRAKVEVEEKPQGLGNKFKSLAKKREEEELARQREAEGKKKKKKKKTKVVEGAADGHDGSATAAEPTRLDGDVKVKKKKRQDMALGAPSDPPVSMPLPQDTSKEPLAPAASPPSPSTAQPVAVLDTSFAVPRPSDVDEPTSTISIPAPAEASQLANTPSPPPMPAAEMDVDDDIFGDAGDYNPGLSDVSSDDDDEGQGAEESVPIIAKKGRGWFGDEEEEPEKEANPLLSDALRAGKPSSSAANPIDASGSLSRSPSPDPILPGQSLRRLEPLASSSGPSARELLERAKYEEEQDKRRSKKAAWRAKQGLAKQDTGDDDDDEGYRKKDDDKDKHEKRRRTREMQQLQAHMTKKGML